MELWADVAFRIGSSHTVCEDYACEMGGKVALSDGCSGGENTDVGARLLSRVALRLAHGTSETDGIGRQAAIVARSTANLLGSGKSSLLATLLLARPLPEGFAAWCWGDGFLFFELESGWAGWRVEWPNESPPYPVYRSTSEWEGIGTVRALPETKTVPFDGTCFKRDIRAATGVGLLSDGFSSFYYEGDRRPVAEVDVLAELLSFKLYGPGFVQRRMSAFKRRCDKLGWNHYDDISLAVIKRTS